MFFWISISYSASSRFGSPDDVGDGVGVTVSVGVEVVVTVAVDVGVCVAVKVGVCVGSGVCVRVGGVQVTGTTITSLVAVAAGVAMVGVASIVSCTGSLH